MSGIVARMTLEVDGIGTIEKTATLGGQYSGAMVRAGDAITVKTPGRRVATITIT